MKNLNLLLTVIIVAIASTVTAQTPPVDENGLAIGGYDVVAYFSNTAVKGKTKITAEYNKATYQFSTKENRNAFKKNPSKYVPQFDGYCAWGVAAQDTKFPINPETYDIVDGQLYLFFNGPFDGTPFNAIEPWNVETTALRKTAHEKWPTVKSK